MVSARKYILKTAALTDLAGAAIGSIAGAGAGYSNVDKKDSTLKKVQKVVGGALLGGAAGHGVHQGAKSIYGKFNTPVAKAADNIVDDDVADTLVDAVKGNGKVKGKDTRQEVTMDKPKKKPNLPGSTRVAQ